MTDTDILAALLHKHRQSCIGRAARRCQGCEREARDLLAAGVTLAALRSTPAAPHQHRFDVVIRDDEHMRLLGCSNTPCEEAYQWDR